MLLTSDRLRVITGLCMYRFLESRDIPGTAPRPASLCKENDSHQDLIFCLPGDSQIRQASQVMRGITAQEGRG